MQTIDYVPTFKREQYPRALTLFEDAANFPRTYDEWEARIKKGCEMLKSKGIPFVVVEIDCDTFPAWCALKGFKLDSRARHAFCAAETVKRFESRN